MEVGEGEEGTMEEEGLVGDIIIIMAVVTMVVFDTTTDIRL